uniref:Uncharacterized protein n=1 Tax=Plectus sambesii TaxID=2011161 RepID=A0A914V850_9BILA
DSPHVRQRRLSNSSVGSNDSMSIFPTLPTLGSNRLETINSDVESMATDLESNAGSAFLGRASKEQISSVLHKLQGRAANYKDKYRDLVKNYNEVIRENDKCRTVLAATQDKALQRIDKLREEKRLMQTRMTEIENQIRAKMDERD